MGVSSIFSFEPNAYEEACMPTQFKWAVQCWQLEKKKRNQYLQITTGEQQLLYPH